ncbi:MAG: FHA domain-containing protein [Deltaproteobacteria bacterium]|nr:FHA domain-containing protein [Deltaproteobacteria bacterium]
METIIYNGPSQKLSPFELVVVQGQEKGRRYAILQGRQTFGRSSENDILIDEPTVSKKHGVIDYTEEGKLFVYDLSFRNGIAVQGEKAPIVQLKEGQSLQIGAVLLKLVKTDVGITLPKRVALLNKRRILAGGISVALVIFLLLFVRITPDKKGTLTEVVTPGASSLVAQPSQPTMRLSRPTGYPKRRMVTMIPEKSLPSRVAEIQQKWR